MSGQIIPESPPLPTGTKPLEVSGSPITAAAAKVEAARTEQAGAVNALGGKLTGGGEVAVTVPMTPSAGGVNHPKVFAGAAELLAQAQEQGKFDSLGGAPDHIIGGKRHTQKHKRHARRRRISRHTRKHRRTSRRTHRVRHTRRRVHARR